MRCCLKKWTQLSNLKELWGNNVAHFQKSEKAVRKIALYRMGSERMSYDRDK